MLMLMEIRSIVERTLKGYMSRGPARTPTPGRGLVVQLKRLMDMTVASVLAIRRGDAQLAPNLSQAPNLLPLEPPPSGQTSYPDEVSMREFITYALNLELIRIWTRAIDPDRLDNDLVYKVAMKFGTPYQKAAARRMRAATLAIRTGARRKRERMAESVAIAQYRIGSSPTTRTATAAALQNKKEEDMLRLMVLYKKAILRRGRRR